MLYRSFLLFLFVLWGCQPGKKASTPVNFSFEAMKYNSLGLSIYLVVVRDSANAVTDTDTLGLFHSDAILKRNQQYLMQWRQIGTANAQFYLADSVLNSSYA